MSKIKRALFSVSDKSGIVEFARALAALGVPIVSTGGTAKLLEREGVAVTEVSAVTGFPEMLDGRVKTLHPKVFGGLLGLRGKDKHVKEMETHGISPIDLLIVNLYPFETACADPSLPEDELIEYIDIGGSALLRAASKNFDHVAPICDPEDYAPVLEELQNRGALSQETRWRLAAKAFGHTAHYDAMISRHFRHEVLDDISNLKSGVKITTPIQNEASLFPSELTLGLKKLNDLRYGENPHQKASLYQETGVRAWGIVHAEKLQGKELSFNNYLDLDAAWNIVNAFAGSPYKGAACVIIKHNNPSCAASLSTVLLHPITPPNALMGSAA